MNTESYHGLRAKLPILDDCPITLDDIYEIIYAPDNNDIFTGIYTIYLQEYTYVQNN